MTFCSAPSTVELLLPLVAAEQGVQGAQIRILKYVEALLEPHGQVVCLEEQRLLDDEQHASGLEQGT